MQAAKNEVEEFYKQIGALAVAFNREADEALLMAYRIGLTDVPLPAVKRAVADALKAEQFMPTVATLRRMAGAELSTKSRAVIAFDALGSAVTHHGAYKSVRFTDPILNTTLQSLGDWVRICETPIDQWDSFFRNRFMEAYQGNLEAKRGTMFAQLGIAAVENTGAGYETNLPILIAVNVPKVPGLSYTLPEERRHLMRDGETKRLANDIGRIDEITTEGKS